MVGAAACAAFHPALAWDCMRRAMILSAMLTCGACGRLGYELQQLGVVPPDEAPGMPASPGTPQSLPGPGGASGAGGRSSDDSVPPLPGGSDAGLTGSGGALVDSGLPVTDAGTHETWPTLLVRVDNTGGEALQNYAARIDLNTQELVTQGRLSPLCCSARAYLGNACEQAIPAWIAPDTCNSATSEVWINLPEIAADATQEVRIVLGCDAPQIGALGPEQVFYFFDDFTAPLDPAKWHLFTEQNGKASVQNGMFESQGPAALVSVQPVYRAGERVLGARVKAQSGFKDDVEIGAGLVVGTPQLPHLGRNWEGMSAISWGRTDFSGVWGAGSPCAGHLAEFGHAEPFVGLGGAARGIEFSYENVAGRAEVSVRTSTGFSAVHVSPDGCVLNEQTQAYLSFDSTIGGQDLLQQMDYVYIRSYARTPPRLSQMPTGIGCP